MQGVTVDRHPQDACTNLILHEFAGMHRFADCQRVRVRIRTRSRPAANGICEMPAQGVSQRSGLGSAKPIVCNVFVFLVAG